MARIILAGLFSLISVGQSYGQSSGDALTDAVNMVRASYNLYPLVYDQNLANWAAQNNAHGFGHFVMGSAMRQNAAWGATTVHDVVAMWMGSPGHRSAILDTSCNACGGAWDGRNWTWNAGRVALVQSAPVVVQQAPAAPQVPSKTLPTPQVACVMPVPQYCPVNTSCQPGCQTACYHQKTKIKVKIINKVFRTGCFHRRSCW